MLKDVLAERWFPDHPLLPVLTNLATAIDAVFPTKAWSILTGADATYLYIRAQTTTCDVIMHFTGNTPIFDGRYARKVRRANEDGPNKYTYVPDHFPGINAANPIDVAGWIAELVAVSTPNLDYEGNVLGKHVLDSAQVYGDAVVMDNAVVFGGAQVSGHAIVRDQAQVGGLALVQENAFVANKASILGYAKVSGSARVSNNTQVSGYAQVFGDAWVTGHARVCGNAIVRGNAFIGGNVEIGGTAVILSGHWTGNTKVADGTWAKPPGATP